MLLLAVASSACATTATVSPTPRPTPIPTPAGGEEQLTVTGLPLSVTVTLPPGWEAEGSLVSRSTEEAGTAMSVSVWLVQSVYRDPCRWRGALLEVGPTAGELADALAAQPTRRARQSVVKLGELTAHWITMRVPGDADLASCDEGEFRSWESRAHDGPGQIDEVYVIDVGGTRVVVDAAYFPDASSEEIAEIHRIVGSMRFAAV
jgi:hypothetical protein